MKRITGFLLALTVLIGVAMAGGTQVSAEAVLTASDECIRILKLEEGFSEKPYWDYTQWTVGYGTECPDDMLDTYKEKGITEAEAEDLLRNHLAAVEKDLNNLAGKHDLKWTQNQFDALVLFSYNCGTGWCFKDGTFYSAIINSATGNDLIRAFALWCSAGDEIQTGLLRRRLCEANMYLNNVYSQTPPDNYCYVLYDANGGTTSPRSQGYDAAMKVAPYPVPTRSGYTFQGWYTAKIGGEKITVLTADHNATTLYARWADADGNEEQITEPTVSVSVTGSGVNLRRGPGTNYAKIGTADKGDKLTITETASGSGLRWGKYTENGGGWICLDYTNYDEALKALEQEGGSSGSATATTTTAAPTTTTTAPTTTTTAAPTTAATTPTTGSSSGSSSGGSSSSSASKTVMGTVKVSQFLRIRKGAGTGYAEVGRLKPNDRVEILEQKVVGATVWGRITSGWISLDYVKLDSTTSSGSSSTAATTTWTGKIVNCSEWVRIRSGAGTSYSVAGYYYPGNTVTITEKKTVGSTVWGKTAKGWVSMAYVQVTATNTSSGSTGSSGSSSGSTSATTWTGKIVNCSQWVRIRSGAGTSYSVAGYYYLGNTITIIEKKTVGSTTWGKTAKGWVSMDYVKVTATNSGTGSTASSGSTSTTTSTKTVTADCLNVRKAAGTSNSVVGYLYYGAKVTILETKTVNGTQWGRISSGWICMTYVK